ncbi:xanthine dehydrogenase family protein molybdopterin-binding subunit [Cupriavidus basilensis]|uniref:Xanthine dehydrogenase family protein molybdopterin-binding subunit n=1 Tax=Cupriavidus basilensis TaxID=68895 RepID=A0ABT6AKJ0_9BURK|nr:xanthine dehydrogenase family protein molybdopterin-binding subunit [Cupriavidus basilensis]MDF3833101.1 xanthine dehydrogenase family protein molybdopterin-binding subunit [Cupriavidus basilensis]
MLNRRTFLLRSAGIAGAMGALVVGWSVMPPRQRLVTADPLPLDDSQAGLNGWVKVASDNTVTVMMSKSEMGQGVHTGLAMLLAEELDADWAQVRVEHSPIDKIYNNQAATVDGLPFHPDDDGAVKTAAGWMTRKLMREIGTMMTGGSSSIKDLWLPMREAGASARAMLISAAAEQWKVPAGECRAEAGKVLHASGRTASFGELAALAARQPRPDTVALKDPARFKLVGQPVRRIEAASKLDGSARFGIDVLPDGLLYASVAMCPTLGGTVAGFDGTAAARLPGVVKVIQVGAHNGGSGGVAVIADTPYRAMRALKQVTVQWDHGAAAQASSAAIQRQLAQTLDEAQGHAYYSHGDVDAALSTAARTVVAEYHAPYLAHAALEPANCTVRLKDGAATVWASTQVPRIARDQAARALGIPADKVDLKVQLLGGGFGRRLEADFISQAAAIAREVEGRPVQTIWSREQDIRHDFYRPACVSRFKAGLDKAGKLVAWHNTSAGQAIMPNVLARSFGLPAAGPDKTTSEGAFDQPYEWPNARIGHEIVELPVPVGFWRSVGHSHQAFFKESFVDEVAVAAGQDPVAFRSGLLAHHPRHLAVLQRAAALSDWGKPLAPAADGAPRARGVALHQSFGSIVAQVAEVSLGPDKRIRVHRVVCVIDCGTPVNPNLIRQQMESAVVFGLSAALYGEITIAEGQVQQSNFHDYPVLRIDACPAIETEIMPSQAPPEGVGEPGTPPIAPAIANALFALTGQRLRALPLQLA